VSPRFNRAPHDLCHSRHPGTGRLIAWLRYIKQADRKTRFGGLRLKAYLKDRTRPDAEQSLGACYSATAERAA